MLEFALGPHLIPGGDPCWPVPRCNLCSVDGIVEGLKQLVYNW